MYLPSWAISVGVAAFFGVLGLAAWGVRYFGHRLHADVVSVSDKLDGVGTTVADIDKRLVRVETLVNGGSAPVGTHTPPHGSPTIRPGTGR